MSGGVAVILVRRPDDPDAVDLAGRFRAALPGAAIRVVEGRRRLWAALADVDADIAILADGAADAAAAPEMVRRLRDGGYDMAIGVRAPAVEGARAFRPAGRRTARALSRFYRRRFGARFADPQSPYRALSRRLVRSFGAVGRGLDLELEICAHAALLRLPSTDLSTRYAAREGETGPIADWIENVLLWRRMVRLLLRYRPRAVFDAIAFAGAFAALGLAAPMIAAVAFEGAPARPPTALLATGMVLLSALAAATGVLLDSHVRLLLEARRLRCLDAANGRPAADLESPASASTWNAMFVRRSS